ncbi:MAG: hypothetical protein ACFFG0_03635 [Candidatus Thorarchaeota archaeon]
MGKCLYCKKEINESKEYEDIRFQGFCIHLCSYKCAAFYYLKSNNEKIEKLNKQREEIEDLKHNLKYASRRDEYQYWIEFIIMILHKYRMSFLIYSHTIMAIIYFIKRIY